MALMLMLMGRRLLLIDRLPINHTYTHTLDSVTSPSFLYSGNGGVLISLSMTVYSFLNRLPSSFFSPTFTSVANFYFFLLLSFFGLLTCN